MSVTEVFQRKIRQELKMTDLKDKKPKIIVPLDQIQPQQFPVNLKQLLVWSINNQQLCQKIIKNGYAQFICNWEYLYSFYDSLSFQKQDVYNIDTQTMAFNNLKVLNLSFNNIKVLQNIPRNLQRIELYFNRIQNIRLNRSFENLIHLGLGYNQLLQNHLPILSKHFPILKSMDIGFNNLSNLQHLITQLRAFLHLKILVLKGNPITLLAKYSQIITKQLKNLVYLDDQKLDRQEKKKAKRVILIPPPQEKKQEKKDDKKQSKKDNKKQSKKQKEKQQPPPPVVQQKIQEKEEVFEYQKFLFKMKISSLQNLKGFCLDKSIYPEYQFVISFQKQPIRFQSSYYIEFPYLDKFITSFKNPVLFQQGVTQQQNSRINFNFEFTDQSKPELAIRDWMRYPFKIKVYKKEPILQESQEQKKPVISEDGLPQMESILYSVCRVDLSSLLDGKIKQIKRRYRLFDGKLAGLPELLEPLQTQGKIVKQKKKQLQKIQQQKDQLQRKKLQEEQVAKKDKKGGKDQKKGAPKKQAKKGGKQQQRKQVLVSEFQIETRQYCALSEQQIYKCLSQKLGIQVTIS